MSLSPGTRLGPYEVTAKLGEGGMGEVWRARDSLLGREVALEVLPEAFTQDPERSARFEREAKVLASLDHPNIAQIIDGASDEHIWAETYDRDLTDIFAIQTDVALSIAKALRAELSNDEHTRVGRRATDDLEAYELYLRGRSAFNRFTPEGFRLSLQELERAVARDPNFGLACASIAQVHGENGISGVVGQEPERSIRLAKELDPLLIQSDLGTALLRQMNLA